MTVDEDLEARSQRRHELACKLVRGLRWGSDYMDHMRPYEPGRLVSQARRAIRGLDGADPRTAARRLADACTVLLQLVEEARYPLWAEGHDQADYYRDEAEELVSLVNDEDVMALAPRTLYRRIRRAVDGCPSSSRRSKRTSMSSPATATGARSATRRSKPSPTSLATPHCSARCWRSSSTQRSLRQADTAVGHGVLAPSGLSLARGAPSLEAARFWSHATVASSPSDAEASQRHEPGLTRSQSSKVSQPKRWDTAVQSTGLLLASAAAVAVR